MLTESNVYLALDVEQLETEYKSTYIKLPWPGPLLPVDSTVYIGGWDADVTGHSAYSSDADVLIECGFQESTVSAISKKEVLEKFLETLRAEGWTECR